MKAREGRALSDNGMTTDARSVKGNQNHAAYRVHVDAGVAVSTAGSYSSRSLECPCHGRRTGASLRARFSNGEVVGKQQQHQATGSPCAPVCTRTLSGLPASPSGPAFQRGEPDEVVPEELAGEIIG